MKDEKTPDGVSGVVSETLRELRKPLNNLSAIHQVFKQNEEDLGQVIQITRHDMNELCEKMGFVDDMRDNKIYHRRLEEILAEKNKDVDIQTATLPTVSEIKAETAKLKNDLKNQQQQTDVKVRAHHTHLEKEQGTFAAYLNLSGYVRLDSQHPGPEVRGTVSRTPTAEVTFSLQPAELTAVRLTNRLWTIAAEHAAGHPAAASRGAEPTDDSGRCLLVASQGAEESSTSEGTSQSAEQSKTLETTS